MVELKPITKENLDAVLALRIRDSQAGFVSSVAEALSQAYVYRDTAYPFAVYHGGDAVGFIMLGYYEKKAYYTLWKLLIDAQHQNKGFGREALEKGIAFLQRSFGITEIYTGVVPKNTAAKRLYVRLGFQPTGTVEDGMEEMRLTL